MAGIIICIIRYLISLLFISTVRLCVVENPFDTVIHQPAYRRKTPKPTLAIKKKPKKLKKPVTAPFPNKSSLVLYMCFFFFLFSYFGPSLQISFLAPTMLPAMFHFCHTVYGKLPSVLGVFFSSFFHFILVPVALRTYYSEKDRQIERCKITLNLLFLCLV